jgi:LemA protein
MSARAAAGSRRNDLPGRRRPAVRRRGGIPAAPRVRELYATQELTDTEDKIAAARRAQRDVLRYNTRQQTFPTLLVARLFRFQTREFFEAGEDADAPVSVAFGN